MWQPYCEVELHNKIYDVKSAFLIGITEERRNTTHLKLKTLVLWPNPVSKILLFQIIIAFSGEGGNLTGCRVCEWVGVRIFFYHRQKGEI